MIKNRGGILLFVLINLLIFAGSNARRIDWLQDEILAYRFYWSMDSIEKLTLHTGITFEDLKKPFVSRFTVGAFRPRQISSFVEMISFKIGQFAGWDYFRDYFQIFLHLFNVLLFGFLVRKLSGSLSLALISAMLALNSGAVLATLFFPFRLAKMLAVTFFLLGFILLLKEKGRFDLLKFPRLVLFFTTFVMGIFTDESFVFLSLVYFIYLWLSQGRAVLFNKRICGYLVCVFGISVVLGVIFYRFSQQFDGNFNWHQDYYRKLGFYWTHPATLIDLVRSFWLFLNRNFGYWELSLMGILSFVACAVIVFFAVRGKHQSKDRIFAFMILFVIFLKTLLLPHMRLHPHIMPADAVFPSLLYFSYYYIYVESFLIILMLAFLLISLRDRIKLQYGMMICVTLIGICNAVNAPRGIADTLKFHGLDRPERRESVENFRELKRFISDVQREPYYLSFPAGQARMVDGRFGFDEPWPLYTAYVLTMILPDLVSGKAVISLENIPDYQNLSRNSEMGSVKTFYDIATRQSVDVALLKSRYGFLPGEPMRIAGDNYVEVPVAPLESQRGDLIFFIKGQSQSILQFNGKIVSYEQYYGESYQLFWTRIEKQTTDEPGTISLKIKPGHREKEVFLVGPVMINR